MRLRPLGVCSGTVHSNSEPRKPTSPRLWLHVESQLSTNKCCLLVDSFCNYMLVIASQYLQFIRPVGLSMTDALRKSPAASIVEINSKHNRLSRSHLEQIKCASHPLRKKNIKDPSRPGQDAQPMIYHRNPNHK